jgi:hypothetical protein
VGASLSRCRRRLRRPEARVVRGVVAGVGAGRAGRFAAVGRLTSAGRQVGWRQRAWLACAAIAFNLAALTARSPRQPTPARPAARSAPSWSTFRPGSPAPRAASPCTWRSPSAAELSPIPAATTTERPADQQPLRTENQSRLEIGKSLTHRATPKARRWIRAKLGIRAAAPPSLRRVR